MIEIELLDGGKEIQQPATGVNAANHFAGLGDV